MASRGGDHKASAGGSVALVLFDCFVAFFLAFSISAETLMNYTGSLRSLYPLNYLGVPSFSTIALFVVLFLAFMAVLRVVRKRLTPRSAIESGYDDGEGLWAYVRSHKGAFLAVFLVLLAAWTALLVQFWPGTCMNDQLYIIEGPVSTAATHPLLYNLALSACVRVSVALFGSGNLGFAAFIVLQMIICSGIVSFCCMWLRYHKAPLPVMVIAALFFAVVPLVASYSVNAWKDTLFGYIMLLWIPFTWESCFASARFWQSKVSYVLMALLICATALIRNNGLLIAVPFSVILMLACRRSVNVRRGIASFAIALVICMLPPVFLSAHGVHQLFREAVNVPLQQLSCVQVVGNEGLDESSRAYLDELLPREDVSSSYMPVNADGVKYMGWFDPDFMLDRTKLQFARAYLDAGSTHPGLFTRAYLAQTYGNWSLIAFDAEQSYELALSGNLPFGESVQLMESFGLHNQSFYPQPLQEWFEEVYPRLLVFPGPGACYALVLLVGFALTVRFRSAKALLLVLPLMLLWVTLMLATPISLALRYVFPMICALPFLAGSLAIKRAG